MTETQMPEFVSIEKSWGRHWLTWCTRCEDGYRGSKQAGSNWARKHLTERHN